MSSTSTERRSRAQAASSFCGRISHVLNALRDLDEHAQGTPHMHEKRRSLVLFITDGEQDKSDEARATRLLEESQRRGEQVYFLFIGA